jgi:hypothetical protein
MIKTGINSSCVAFFISLVYLLTAERNLEDNILMNGYSSFNTTCLQTVSLSKFISLNAIDLMYFFISISG